MDNLKKKPFTAPKLTEFGTLPGLTQNRHKIDHGHGHPGCAWSHYKFDKLDERETLLGLS